MTDHDQRLKSLIQMFFPQFMELFLSSWAKRFDFSEVEFLTQEVFPDPPDGDRHLMDIVAKLKTFEPILEGGGIDPNALLALVHVEVESPDTTTRVKPRFKDYYLDLRRKYGLAVLPIALYLKVGKDGIGIDVYTESFWELETLRVQYLYIGLPALDAVEYLNQENPLGWALISLMKLPKDRIIELGKEAFDKIANSSLEDQQKFLLAECLDAYLPLDQQGREGFHDLVFSSSDSGVQPMGKTIFEKIREKEKEDSLRAFRSSALLSISSRFNVLPETITQRVQTLSIPELTSLLVRSGSVSKIEDLFE